LPNNDVALYAEGRRHNCNDQGGQVDIVFKISKDNGQTFGPLIKLYGETTNTTQVTIGNPSMVATADGKVLLLCVRNSQRLLMLRSSDAAGRVWPAVATDITEEVFGPGNTRMECASGAIPAGGDLFQANVTIAAAKEWCLANSTCGGFTTATPAATTCSLPNTDGGKVLHMYFKSQAGFLNKQGNWTSWMKPGPPGVNVATGPPAGMVRF
jgi:hypothetical protein